MVGIDRLPRLDGRAPQDWISMGDISLKADYDAFARIAPLSLIKMRSVEDAGKTQT